MRQDAKQLDSAADQRACMQLLAGQLHYLCATCVWDYRDRTGKFASLTRHGCVKKLERVAEHGFVETCCNCGEVANPVEASFIKVGDMVCSGHR